MWYYDNVGGGRCPIVDTFWQTETGGHMITPLPGVTPLVPGSCTLPFPGIQAAIVDEDGARCALGAGRFPGRQEALAVDDPHHLGRPGALQEVLFTRPSFSGKLYLAGDGAVRDAKTGYFTIMGRIDDVLNVSGHRMGTMEIESALVSNPLVAEAAVVGRPDDLTGEAICAFVVLKRARPAPKKRRRSPPSCATGSARKSARSPSPRTSASVRTCPRRAPARSCAACCARWPRVRRSRRTPPRWRTRRFSISSSRTPDRCRSLEKAGLRTGFFFGRFLQ
jgi:acetyl-CoA synthetase